MEFEEFKNIAGGLLPEASDGQFAKFEALGPLYRELNARINVISRKDIDEIYSHHVLHSLAIAVYVRNFMPQTYAEWTNETGAASEPVASILDLGCGGGFPGIPLAIMFPNARFVLCDSIGKKITVANEVATAVGLHNVSTVNARAESIDGRFNWIVSRAVTSLDKFMPWVRGKYSDGILYLKGGDLCEEISDAMRREKMRKGSVELWPLDCVLKDSWFKEKKLIIIR